MHAAICNPKSQIAIRLVKGMPDQDVPLIDWAQGRDGGVPYVPPASLTEFFAVDLNGTTR